MEITQNFEAQMLVHAERQTKAIEQIRACVMLASLIAFLVVVAYVLGQ